MHQELINTKSGGIIIENNEVLLGDDLTTVSSKIGPLLTLQEQRNGWAEYRITSVEFGEEILFIDLLFENRTLEITQMYMNIDRLTEPEGWEEWTEEFEQKRLHRLQQWLEKEIGQQNEFSWGKMKAHCDKKGSTSIISMVKT